MIAVYGCWRGHSTKQEFVIRELVAPEWPCQKCKETANLFSVLDADKPVLRVIDGGKKD